MIGRLGEMYGVGNFFFFKISRTWKACKQALLSPFFLGLAELSPTLNLPMIANREKRGEKAGVSNVNDLYLS